MTYDRSKTAGVYDKHLSNAEAQAKGHWGSGWANLTEEMKNAYVCSYLVGNLAGIDFEAAFGDRPETELEHKLLARLLDLEAVLNAATKA